MKEFRIFGPPGTGKTQRLATRDIPRAVERFGPEKVMVASFTRAAAEEIASRGITVDSDNVGTLHSLCFRALGQPDLTVKHIKKWNDAHPAISIKGETGDLDGESMIEPNLESEGDDLLAKMMVLRSKMVPVKMWLPSIQKFHKKWEAFKDDLHIMDFQDLIEKALAEIPIAPNNPRVMFLDEAQDFTPSQISLVRSWGLNMDWIVLTGDDDQTLYSWMGCVPETMMLPKIDPEFQTTLSRSYRVPASVHKVAMKMILRVKNRVPKEYSPRIGEDFEFAEGEVRNIDAHSNYPDDAVELAREYADDGKTVMFLASCSYMLEKIRHKLRSKGIPFHNPYRKKQRQWNPLVRSDKLVTSTDLLINFLDKGEDGQHWTVAQFVKWAKYLSVGDTGLVRSSGKKYIKALEQAVAENLEGLHTTREFLSQVLNPDAMKHALDRNVNWLQASVLTKQRRSGLIYPSVVYRKHGIKALTNRPKILIGTIHSTKGTESDVVFLMPDISNAAAREMERREGREAVYRMFYVGITRARETLIKMSPPPGSKNSVIQNVEF